MGINTEDLDQLIIKHWSRLPAHDACVYVLNDMKPFYSKPNTGTMLTRINNQYFRWIKKGIANEDQIISELADGNTVDVVTKNIQDR